MYCNSWQPRTNCCVHFTVLYDPTLFHGAKSDKIKRNSFGKGNLNILAKIIIEPPSPKNIFFQFSLLIHFDI